MKMDLTWTARVHEGESLVPPGQTCEIELPGSGFATLKVVANGSSALVTLSTSTRARRSAGTARFDPAPGIGANGVITDATACADITGPLSAIRVQNTGAADITVEFVQ